MTKAPLRVVFYAVNGTGVGHLVRLLSIARWMRRYSAILGQPLEAWFLTSSEADAIVFAEGFAAFKIPSKTIVADAGLDRRAYLALAKQWVWHTLGLLRPDILVVDTFPRGSFGELLSALDLCKHRVFVHRPVKEEVARRPDFQAMLPLYDAIIVPEHEAELFLPEAVRARVTRVGPVLSRERCEMLVRDEARARLGVSELDKCIYISAGGGGDAGAEEQLLQVVGALRHEKEFALVVGTGPLYRGRPVAGATALSGTASEYMNAFDAAVCAAGYNTFGELMFAGVPTLFIPQSKRADDQAARAERACESGAARVFSPGDSVLEHVRALLLDSGAREAAKQLMPENCARAAAAEILRLVHNEVVLDDLEEAFSDDRLLAMQAHHEADVLDLAARLRRGRDAHDGAAIDGSIALLGQAPLRELRGIVDGVIRVFPDANVDMRVRHARSCVEGLGAFVGGEGAAARAAASDGGVATCDALVAAIRERIPTMMV